MVGVYLNVKCAFRHNVHDCFDVKPVFEINGEVSNAASILFSFTDCGIGLRGHALAVCRSSDIAVPGNSSLLEEDLRHPHTANVERARITLDELFVRAEARRHRIEGGEITDHRRDETSCGMMRRGASAAVRSESLATLEGGIRFSAMESREARRGEHPWHPRGGAGEPL
jgi:hypothetical protein